MKNFISLPDALASLNKENIQFIDGTYRGLGRAGYDRSRIGNGVYFDIDEIADKQAHMAHTMPTSIEFAQHMSDLGIEHDNDLIIYAQENMAMAAARVWYMFKYFGHGGSVKILDGSLKLWTENGHEVNSNSPEPLVSSHYKCYTNKQDDTNYDVVDYDSILSIQNRETEQILDVRGDRAYAAEHIPNSHNLFFMNLFNEQGCLKPLDEVKDAITSSIDLNKRTTVSCGSGVTACMLLAAMDEIGFNDIALYDGSWSDYSNHRDAPIEKSHMRFF